MNACLPGLGSACKAVGNAVGSAVGNVASSAATDALNSIARAMIDGATELLRTLATAWVHVPTPTSDDSVAWLAGTLNPLVAAVAVGSLLVAAGKTALSGNGRDAARGVAGLIRLITVTGPGVALVFLGLNWGDTFSTWILNQATQQDPTSHINGLSAAISVAFASTSIQMLLGLLAIIGSIIQIALMFLRVPLLVVVVALWPLAAAASSTETGMHWERKLRAWLLALVFYKPVAAFIYAAAFKMMQPDNDPATVLGGIALTVFAVAALPALMRFFAPMVAAVGGGNGAGAAAAGVATGAVTVGTAVATLGASTAPVGVAGLASKSPTGATGTGGPAFVRSMSNASGAASAAQQSTRVAGGAMRSVVPPEEPRGSNGDNHSSN